jgi:hypothetical protein
MQPGRLVGRIPKEQLHLVYVDETGAFNVLPGLDSGQNSIADGRYEVLAKARGMSYVTRK